MAPVGQLGERIVQRLVRLALLRGLVRAQVTQDGHAAATVLLLQGSGQDFHWHLVAVAVQQGCLVGIFRVLAHAVCHRGAKARCHVALGGLAQQLRHRVTQQALQCIVAIRDGAALVEDDGLVGDLGELAHPLFTQAHGAFGLPALGDVVDQHKDAALHARAVQVRQQVDFNHALLATGQCLLAQVLDLLALQAARHMRPDGVPGCFANGLAHRQADDGSSVVSVVGRIAGVGKTALESAHFVIRHQRRHCVGYQAQQWCTFYLL